MAEVAFGLVSIIAAVSAFLVVTRKNPIYSALFLVALFGSISAQFFLLGAEFLGFMQLLVYAGAIMVLYLFVIMLINPRPEQLPEEGGALDRGVAAGVALLVFGFLFVAIQGSELFELKRRLPNAQADTEAYEQELGQIAVASADDLEAEYDIGAVADGQVGLARKEARAVALERYRERVVSKTVGFSQLARERRVSKDRLATLPEGSPERVWAEHGSVEAFGQTLFREHLFEFELTSVLILIAIVGAVHLSLRPKRRDKKRDETDDEPDASKTMETTRV